MERPAYLHGPREWYVADGTGWQCKLCSRNATIEHMQSTGHIKKVFDECQAKDMSFHGVLNMPPPPAATSAPRPAVEQAAVTWAPAGPAKPNFKGPPQYKSPPPALPVHYIDHTAHARHVEQLQQQVTQLDLRVEALDARVGALEQTQWHGGGGWLQRGDRGPWQWRSPAGDNHQRAGAALLPPPAPGGSYLQSGAPLDRIPNMW